MFRTEVRVRFGETDPYGVAYFTSHLEYAKTALDEYLRSMGLSPAEFYRSASGGLARRRRGRAVRGACAVR